MLLLSQGCLQLRAEDCVREVQFAGLLEVEVDGLFVLPFEFVDVDGLVLEQLLLVPLGVALVSAFLSSQQSGVDFLLSAH